MRRARSAVLLALAAGAVVLVAIAVNHEDVPARVANTATTVAATAGSPSTPAPTSTTAVPEATGEVVGPDAHLGDGDADAPRPGVVVTNSGSATASVGGNVVSGSPGPGDPPGAIVTGDATAIGNSSSVRTP